MTADDVSKDLFRCGIISIVALLASLLFSAVPAFVTFCFASTITGNDDNFPELAWKSGSMWLVRIWNNSGGFRGWIYLCMAFPFIVAVFAWASFRARANYWENYWTREYDSRRALIPESKNHIKL